MKIKAKKLFPEAILPQAMRPGDAAMDFYSLKDYLIKVGERVIVETGVAIAIPDGFWGNIRDRGGLPAKHGIHTMGGVFDSNYRGDVSIIMVNLGQEDYQIKKGDRIAQMIIEKHEDIEIEEVSDLDQTNRGESRFASSGY